MQRIKRRFLNPKKCKETKKTMFKSETEASRAMFRVWSHDSSADIYDLHTYVCEHCGHWHFGHKSYYEKIRAKFSTTVIQP